MKKQYLEISIELIQASNLDVIATSVSIGGGDNDVPSPLG